MLKDPKSSMASRIVTFFRKIVRLTKSFCPNILNNVLNISTVSERKPHFLAICIIRYMVIMKILKHTTTIVSMSDHDHSNPEMERYTTDQYYHEKGKGKGEDL